MSDTPKENRLLTLFREQMAERRKHPRGSAEHRATTWAAKRYWWSHIGRPVNTWPKEWPYAY